MIIQDEQQLLGYDIAVSISNHLRKQIEGGEETDGGATFKPKGKPLSKGCQEACKGGGWICIFLSFDCHYKCHFCTQYREGPNTTAPSWDIFDSKFPPTAENLKRLAESDEGDIKGISFSGGEPFLQLEETTDGNTGIYDWLDTIENEIDWWKGQKPYLWIYTSGHYVTEENVTKLVGKGIEEIRFNLAASNYSDNILKKMEMVRNKVDKLSVELPVLGWQINKLLGTLKKLDDIGVDYINLHEIQMTNANWRYFIESGLVDYKMAYSISTDKINPAWMFYLPSLIDTYTVIRYIEDNKLNLIYNDCSSRNYKLQNISMMYLKLRLINKNDRATEPWEQYLDNYKKVNRVLI